MGLRFQTPNDEKKSLVLFDQFVSVAEREIDIIQYGLFHLVTVFCV